MEWLRRIWYVINRRRIERELQEEMDVHREMMGNPRTFGNILRLREESRDVWGWNWLDDLQRDFAYAFRGLRRTPIFTLASILIIAVGIALNLTVFQVGNALFLRPLPLDDPDSLVRFDRKSPRFQTNEVPYPAIQFIAAHSNVFSAVLAEAKTSALLGDDTRGRAVAFVSSNWFSGMGYVAQQGRLLRQGLDDRPGADPSVVVSEWFWQRSLGADRGVVGSTIRINDRPATIIGVVSSNVEDFSPNAARVWMPIEQISYFISGSDLRERWDTGPEMYARLRPGISPVAARETLRPLMAGLASQYPDSIHSGEWLEPFTARTRFRNPAFAKNDQLFVLFLSLLAGITLLVACANLGNLVLSRDIARMQEIRIRAALGASRLKVMRPLLAESVLLAGCGCIAGMILCEVALRAFALQIDAPLLSGVTWDWRTAGASLLGSLFTAASVGLMPAWKLSRQDGWSSLKNSSYGTTQSLHQSRARSLLLGLQVTCSCVLLVVGGSLFREMQRAAFAPRIDFENVAAMDASLDRHGIRGAAAREYWRNIANSLSLSPEVEAVSILESVPFGQTSEQGSYSDAPGLRVVSNRVDSSFFGLFGVSFLAGRTFESGDDPRTTVIISRRLAETMYGGLDAVGKPFPKTKPTATIVGVVADAQTMDPKDSRGAQQYVPLQPQDFGNYHLVARAKADPVLLLPVLKAAAQSADRSVVPAIHLLRDDYKQKVRVNRTVDMTIICMALVALFIATLGIFGVVSYAVTLRQKEIGIRLAIGAGRRDIVTLILSAILRPVVPAIVLGIAASVMAKAVLGSFVFMTTSEIPVILSGAAVLLLSVAGLAALVPTMRALRINAANVLRLDS